MKDHPLFDAVCNGDISAILLCLFWGAHIDIQTRNGGMTALMIAACLGNQKICQLLLNEGANIHLKDDEGKTALDYALQANQNDTAEWLKQEIKETKQPPDSS